MSLAERCGRAAGLPSHRGPLTAIAVLCLLVAVLRGAAVAHADVFGPISLVSAGASGSGQLQQAEYAHDPAISGDARYVVFDGSVGGTSGVWRRDLATDAVQAVAGGDAQLPSISGDGRFISFTTNEGRSLGLITRGLGGEAAPQTPGAQEADNVYVRDMSKGPQEEGAFVVASAPDGSSEPLTYAEPGTRLGAVATGRSAISADGNEVAFVTTAVSDLARPQTPSEPNTPSLQVAVRYLHAAATKLVSVDRETGGPVSAQEGGETFGGVYPGGSRTLDPKVPAYAAYGVSPPPGASLSADGSTVAWMGEDVGMQAAMLPAESRKPTYTEPLWRRIAPGSETPTERVTGGSDPANPACAASGETALPSSAAPGDPCQGPFSLAEAGSPAGVWNAAGGQEGDFVPRLSADGYSVAFLSKGLPVALGENFGERSTGEPADLYVADMHPGLTRDQALRPLTELAGGEAAGEESVAPIFDFGVSPDGSQVAFATRRTQFPLGSPAYVSPATGESGMNELFDVDLRTDTLTRVSTGFEGGVSEHPHGVRPAGEDPYGETGDGALSPSFSGDGRLLAFSSTASNLAFGDGNTPPAGPLDGSDAFVVERKLFGVLATQQYISPAPQTLAQLQWRIGVTARSRRDGTVELYIVVPGEGALHASARGAVVIRVRASRRASKGRRARASRKHGSARARRRRTVARRTVASATRPVHGGGGLLTLVLKLAKRYSSLASRRGGLSANVSVVFSSPGRKALRESIPVTFARARTHARRAGAAHGSKRRGRARR